MDETSARAKEYSRQRIRLAVLHLLLTVLFLILMQVLGVSVFISSTSARWSQNYYVQAGLYLCIFSFIYFLVFLSLDFYSEYVLEHKFHLSNQTIADWVKQGIKKWLLSFSLFIAAGELLYFFLRHFPNTWWLYATAAWFLFAVVLGKIAPVLIIPLFYKCRPLNSESLKQTLLDLSKTCGVGVQNVFEIELSRETQKANAAVAGFGKSRRILLSDTLLKNYTDDEIEAVFAHELGHICLRHTLKILMFGALISLISFRLAYVLFNESLGLFGFKQVYDIAAFPILALILLLTGLILVPIQNGLLRGLERQADMFALNRIRDNKNFASAIRKLGEQNLSDPSPSRLVRIFFLTHPPISERISYASKENEKQP